MVSANTKALLLVVMLGACAHTPPDVMVQAKRAVDSRYVPFNFAGDVRPAGLPENAANCVLYSRAYAAELCRRGVPSERVVCHRSGKVPHAVTLSGGWVLDNLYREVYWHGRLNCDFVFKLRPQEKCTR